MTDYSFVLVDCVAVGSKLSWSKSFLFLFYKIHVSLNDLCCLTLFSYIYHLHNC